MTRNRHHLAGLMAAGAALAVCGAVEAAAITTPYENTFSAGESVADFVTTGGTWQQTTAFAGSAEVYRNDISGAVASSALVQASDLGGATQNDFTLSTVFVLTSNNAGANTIGLAALSTSTASTPYYLADVQREGAMRILKIAGGVNTTLDSGSFGQVAINNTAPTWYTMTLTGTYGEGGELTLTFDLTGGGKSLQLSGADATPLTGSHFGIRNRGSGSNAVMSVVYDELSLTAVPEPAGLAVLGGLMLFARHRRAAMN